MFPQNEILPDISFPTTNLASVPNQTINLPDGHVLNSINATKGNFNEVIYTY
jgi:hypothetical protein